MSGANKNQVALGAEEKEAVSAEDVRRDHRTRPTTARQGGAPSTYEGAERYPRACSRARSLGTLRAL